MNELLLTVVLTAIVGVVYVKRILLYTFLYQNREYRIDKIIDYLRLPISKKILFDFWTKWRLLFILLIILNFRSSISEDPETLAVRVVFVVLFSLLWIAIEAGQFGYKLARKRKPLVPVITQKTTAILIVSTVFVLVPVLYMFSVSTYAAVNDVVAFGLPALVVNAIVQIVLLCIPIPIGAAIIMLWPVEHFIRSQKVFQAKKHRNTLKSLISVAISGSYGKSSTKYYIQTLLEPHKKVVATKKYNNTQLSVASRLQQVTPQDEVFLGELGAYKPGESGEVAEMIQPHIALLTGLNNQHIALFKSKERIIASETESFAFVPKDGVIIVNWDAPWCKEITFPTDVAVVKYGTLSKEVDLKGTLVPSTPGRGKVIVSWSGNTYDFDANIVSQGELQNLLAAIAVAIHCGVTIEDIIPECTKLIAPEGTLTTTEYDGHIVIDDTHNANINGVLNAFEYAKSFGVPVYVVLDDIAELGDAAKDTHLLVGEGLYNLQPESVLLVGKNHAHHVSRALIERGYSKDKLLSILQFEQLELPERCVILYEGYSARDFLPS